MKSIEKSLKSNSEEFYEIQELLECFTDYLAFKNLMIDHHKTKKGELKSLENCLIITKNVDDDLGGGGDQVHLQI